MSDECVRFITWQDTAISQTKTSRIFYQKEKQMRNISCGAYGDYDPDNEEFR